MRILEIREGRRAAAFDQAAEDAKHDLYPELYWSNVPPSAITICRVCKGDGYHKDNCALLHPDKKDKAAVEDLLKVSDKDVQRLTWEEIQALKNPVETTPVEEVAEDGTP